MSDEQQNSKKPKQEDEITSFTVDHDRSGVIEMPSVTKLLNRKSLGLKTKSSETAATPPVSQDGKTQIDVQLGSQSAPPRPDLNQSKIASQPEAIEIQLEENTDTDTEKDLRTGESDSKTPSGISISMTMSEVQIERSPGHELQSVERIQPETAAEPAGTSVARASPSISTPQVKVQLATRRSKPTAQLVSWDRQLLESGTDPLGKAIAQMLKKGVHQALFLAITIPENPPAGTPLVPHFVATASVLPGNKQNLWTGLKWDPTVVPEMWNYFVRSGQVELSPPGANTNQNSHRNVVRAAFGILPQEWLVLVRVGPATSCRGVVALVSTTSMLTQLTGVLPLFQAQPPAGNAT